MNLSIFLGNTILNSLLTSLLYVSLASIPIILSCQSSFLNTRVCWHPPPDFNPQIESYHHPVPRLEVKSDLEFISTLEYILSYCFIDKCELIPIPIPLSGIKPDFVYDGYWMLVEVDEIGKIRAIKIYFGPEYLAESSNCLFDALNEGSIIPAAYSENPVSIRLHYTIQSTL